MTQLHLDLRTRHTLHSVWQFGGSIGRASLLLRPEVRRQLVMCRDELGIRNVRCDGVFSPEMHVIQSDGSLDFSRVEQALDALMEEGLVPYLDLSPATPTSATAESAGDPKDAWELWSAMVEGLATTVRDRYGCDAQMWHFHISPSPDDGWSSTRDAYLRLYDQAARALRTADYGLKIGGPSISGAAGLDDFLAHLAQESPHFGLDGPRCDFITTSPAAGVAATLVGPSESDAVLGASIAAEARRTVTRTLSDHIPVYCVGAEHSTLPILGGHDACGAAALLCKRMGELSDPDPDNGMSPAQGALLTNLSDMASDDAGRCEPFHGGEGLLTVNDVRKASFNALKLLAEHRGERIALRWVDPQPGLGALASFDGHELRLLAWHYQERDGSAPSAAKFSVEGLPPSVRWGQLTVIRPGVGSPFEAWMELGRPRFMNRQLLDSLESAAQPAMVDVNFREFPPRLEAGMVVQLTIPIPHDAWEGMD